MTVAALETSPGKEEKKIPGELGAWLFVLGDLTLFSLLFLSYAWDYRDNVELFRAAQSELIKAFGLVNTVLLLSGSLAVVLALKNLRERSARSISYLWLAIGTGLAFIADKIVEYTIEVGAGHTLESGRFFMYYYTLTGLHLLHVMLGVGVLLFMVFEIKAKDCSDEVVSNMESGSAIWHMVDLLWIGLFSLVYLI